MAKSICIGKTAEGMLMKKVKTLSHILIFSADPFLRLSSQKTDIYIYIYMLQICFGDRNVIISNISNASIKLKKLWPNLQIY